MSEKSSTPTNGMILVDTSVWIHHFRVGRETLRSLLDEEEGFCHHSIQVRLLTGCALWILDKLLRESSGYFGYCGMKPA